MWLYLFCVASSRADWERCRGDSWVGEVCADETNKTGQWVTIQWTTTVPLFLLCGQCISLPVPMSWSVLNICPILSHFWPFIPFWDFPSPGSCHSYDFLPGPLVKYDIFHLEWIKSVFFNKWSLSCFHGGHTCQRYWPSKKPDYKKVDNTSQIDSLSESILFPKRLKTQFNDFTTS